MYIVIIILIIDNGEIIDIDIEKFEYIYTYIYNYIKWYNTPGIG